ncbi:MAG: hypothetical protein KME64_10225 [Scytonematopsis contorta HA4267-MV1]|nr:hypothetical protein [Scytonematopsis contorta HA4267-MV1]
MNKNKRKAHICALFISKFDKEALKKLGCNTWNEVYEKIGNALDYRPSVIKLNRDYFDPYFPNNRQGWRKKDGYKIVKEIYQEFKDYDIEIFTEIQDLRKNCQKP